VLAAFARLVLLLALVPAAVSAALGGDALAGGALAVVPVGALALRWRGVQLVATGIALLPACWLLHDHGGLMLVPSALGLVGLGVATRATVHPHVPTA
jgi:hypothetical protein